jgi:hypothetical protein
LGRSCRKAGREQRARITRVSSSEQIVLESIADTFPLSLDTKGVPALYDLADPTQTGAWTLSRPIYTEQVGHRLFCLRHRVFEWDR